jgi:hypothetical protein
MDWHRNYKTAECRCENFAEIESQALQKSPPWQGGFLGFRGAAPTGMPLTTDYEIHL